MVLSSDWLPSMSLHGVTDTSRSFSLLELPLSTILALQDLLTAIVRTDARRHSIRSPSGWDPAAHLLLQRILRNLIVSAWQICGVIAGLLSEGTRTPREVMITNSMDEDRWFWKLERSGSRMTCFFFCLVREPHRSFPHWTAVPGATTS